MTLNHRPRPFMRRFAYLGLAICAFIVVALARPAALTASVKAGIPVRCHNVVSNNPVRALTVLPGETVTFEVMDCDPGSGYRAHPTAGKLVQLDKGRWVWTSPNAPGRYPIQVVDPDGGDAVTLEAFVLVPYDRLRGEFLNGYRIGRYPEKRLPGFSSPAGFVEVTKENENVFVSPHFRLKQFLCKQPTDSPRKYVVLNERLLLALEYALKQVNEAGYPATTFCIMSGYRTPAYNRSIGDVPFSMHQLGAAADIYIDEKGTSVMHDPSGDGLSEIRDAKVLYRLIEDAAARPEAQGLIGGLGKYPSTVAHPSFVHVDVRDRKARW
jgi:hypothetical protein